MDEHRLETTSFNNLWKMAKKINKNLRYRTTTKDELIDTIIGNNKGGGIKKGSLAVFPNEDKLWHEKWNKNRNIMNIPHPFRCVICGPPNCGKTSMILNLLMSNRPYFEKVIVIHCDPEYTKEYNDIDAEMMNEIPCPNEWEGLCKTLVILDDLEYKDMPKEQKRNLNRLFGFVSTHKNISVCLSAQDAFNIPPGVRRCANLWVLWKIDDMDCIKALSRKIRLSAKKITELFEDNLENRHDSIMVDNTDNSPYRIRKNGTIHIE